MNRPALAPHPAASPVAPADREGYELAVTSYDRASSLLVAALVMVGALVGCLLIVWLGGRMILVREPAPVLLDSGGGSEQGQLGQGMELEGPEPAEVLQESDVEQPQLAETLAAVSDLVAQRQAELAEPIDAERLAGGKTGSARGTGNTLALGRGTGEPGTPRAERWQINFDEGLTLAEYAKQLDFFGIELAVIGRGSLVTYAANLSLARPEARRAERGGEQRLHFSWRSGKLQQADRDLLAKAGVKPGAGDVVVQFYPADTENRLAWVEKEYADGRGKQVQQIRRTQFGVRKEGEEYVFEVRQQQYY